MYLDQLRVMRPELLLGNHLDYTQPRLNALAGDPVQLRQELAIWEKRYAEPLAHLADDVGHALLELAIGNATVPGAHRDLRRAVGARCDTMPDLAWLLNATPVLYNPIREPVVIPTDFINTLRVIWIAISKHELLTEAYTEVINSSVPPEEATPENMRWLTREWIATEFKQLRRLGQYVTIVITAIEEYGVHVARGTAAGEIESMHPAVREFARRTPKLRQLVELPEVNAEFKALMQGFSDVLPY